MVAKDDLVSKDTALRMAIEALERVDRWLQERHMGKLTPLEKEALQACKEALAQPAKEPVAWILKHKDGYSYNELKRAIDDKDLAYAKEFNAKWEGLCLERDYNFMRDLAIGWEDAWNKLREKKPIAWTKQSELDKTTTLTNPIVMWKNKYKSIENNIPLYVMPPQQQWVGLNDDEIDKMWEFYRGGWYDFAMAIEAKLKELNT